MIRALALLVAFAATGSAWVESVEFPWNTFPQHLWERELAWLKNIGIRHVSLPPPADSAKPDTIRDSDKQKLRDVIAIVRRLNLEADLQGTIPDDLQHLMRAHGGPLTEALPHGAVRIDALSANALSRERHAVDVHAPAVLWSGVEDTIGSNGFRPGAVNFAGEEKQATVPLRRAAQLSNYWGGAFESMTLTRGAGIEIAQGAKLPSGVSAIEFSSPGGASAVSVINDSAANWNGEIKAIEHGGKPLLIPGVNVPAHGATMIPVHVPLASGPLCKGCSGLAPSDYLVYATAELTAVEYENGIIAMEFSAPVAGEVVLQLDREPNGPLVAGGKPSSFDWDEHSMRVRLPIPAGNDPGNHVRIGLAIEPPDHTAFFENARVLMIGETNHLIAQFSSKEIEGRSRLRISPDLPVATSDPPSAAGAAEAPGAAEPIRRNYNLTVPATAVHGDHAELVLEADAIQMSHVRPQLLRPATLRFPDSVQVRLSQASSYPVYPPAIPVNSRTGREVTVSVRNNAPEIRTFRLSISASGLDFSPATAEISVGASASRNVSFRVFVTGASAGVHTGSVSLSGAASITEPFQMVVIPPGGEVAWTSNGFFFEESVSARASFLPNTWLEYIAKEQGEERLQNPLTPFSPGPIEIAAGALSFSGRPLRLADLERLLPRKDPAAKTQIRPRE